MDVISWIVDFHHHVLEKWGDRRVDNLPFMGSGWQMLALTTSYLYVSLSLGPRLMKNRKPFNITSIIIVYNIVQCIACAGMAIMAPILIGPRINFYCIPLDYTPTPRNLLIIKFTYCYFLLKVVDLLETIFFVLKKSWRQITFLHLYHHASMVILTWIQSRFFSVAVTFLIGYANCIVHTFMYLYYTLSIFYKPSQLAWLKQRITEIQMVQFVVITVVTAITAFNPNCDYPLILGIPFIFNSILFMYLFSKFYYNNYIKAKSRPNEVKTTITSDGS